MTIAHRMACYTLALASSLWPVTPAILADDTGHDIVIAGTQIREVFDDYAPGPYNEVLALLGASFDGRVDLRAMPVKRAQRFFFEGSADCFFVGTELESFYLERGIGRDQLLLSDGVHVVRMRAYTLPGTPVISKASELAGKQVAVDIATGGKDFVKQEFLPPDTRVISANSMDQALALLSQRRVDAVIAFDFDMSLYLNQQDRPTALGYDRAFILAQNNDVIACKRSPATEAFIRHVNSQLALLSSSGRLADLLAPLRLAHNSDAPH